MGQLVAYHGSEALKQQVVAIIDEHQQADRIAGGSYHDERGRFCAVGCTLESIRRIEGLSEIAHSDHALYERYLGVPMPLARLEDSIFEGLEGDDQLTWPRRFAEAIRPGADLSMVWPKFLRRLLADPAGGVQSGIATRDAIRPSVDAVIALFDRWISTGVKPARDEWSQARTADAAAYAAADAAAASAASYAAAASADAAASYAAAAASYAAAAADAVAYGARLAERQRQAAWLLDLLRSA